MKKSFSSGQATTEMVIMLIGFTTLLLGMIFTFGLEIANNQMLLDAKFSAETYANSAEEKMLAGGSEIKSWGYSKVNGAEIPFLLSDKKINSGSSTVDSSYDSIQQQSDSQADNYKFLWTSPKNFNENNVNSDYVTDAFTDAFSAAELVSRTAEVDTYNPLLSNSSSCSSCCSCKVNLDTLGEAFRRWFGIKLNKNTLEQNITNRVYIPANGEK